MTAPMREAFTERAGLAFAFNRVVRSPWRAARLAAFDLAALSILAVLVWTTMKPGAEGSSWIAALIVAWPLWQLVSLSAWLRYLAGQERPGPVPHRLWKTEARLFGLYAVWALIGGIAIFLASLPAGVLWGAAGPQALSALWMMAVFAVGLWFFARFVPLPAKVVVEDTLEPFGFWEETEAIAGRLRWAAASVGAAHIGAVIAMILLALFVGEEPGAALAQTLAHSWRFTGQAKINVLSGAGRAPVPMLHPFRIQNSPGLKRPFIVQKK